ncbi:helix-turn-helix transcriptional regulator [Sulfurifustis variabilis]|nr:helix-turn-helix transcriptional regulator [Sulfurifustis variabilis]
MNLPSETEPLADRAASAPRFMSVRQVAEYLDLHEKKVYALAADGLIPATKVTGKWLFPRDLVDQWLRETSHGGILTDRLIVAGSDDPLLYRAVMQLANEIQARALVSYATTGTQLGLALLARRRADVCAIHWGPAEESAQRHAAMIRVYPQHRDWTLLRAFHREQGLLVAPGRLAELDELLHGDDRWAMRQEGAGSQRFLRDTLARHRVDPSRLRVTARAYSEREAAALIAMDHADVAPGARPAAAEFGLEFVPIGWEAYDLVLTRGIYFRTLFQKLLDALRGAECQRWAQLLGGYDFRECGKVVETD